MKLLTALAATAAVCALTLPVFALELPPVFANFQWNPKAFNYDECLTRHSADYCNAAVSTKPISGGGYKPTP